MLDGGSQCSEGDASSLTRVSAATIMDAFICMKITERGFWVEGVTAVASARQEYKRLPQNSEPSCCQTAPQNTDLNLRYEARSDGLAVHRSPTPTSQANHHYQGN